MNGPFIFYLFPQATPNVLNKAATVGSSSSSSAPAPASSGMSEAEMKKFKVKLNVIYERVSLYSFIEIILCMLGGRF